METYKKEYADYRKWGKAYYHLSSDGWQDGLLFHTPGQYAWFVMQIAIASLLFPVVIYDYSIMPNHFHILLSGTGSSCVKLFIYLKRKLSRRLRADGYPPPPQDYCFKLTRVESIEQLKSLYVYIDRNVLEKGISLPVTYPWGCAYSFYSILVNQLSGKRADEMSRRELTRLTNSTVTIPSHWLFHPALGLLPSSFVNFNKFYELFPSPKEYQTKLVKDYEAYALLAKEQGDPLNMTADEIRELVARVATKTYSGKDLRQLSHDEKGKLCVVLNTNYGLEPDSIASALILPSHVAKQFLRSKDYGKSSFIP